MTAETKLKWALAGLLALTILAGVMTAKAQTIAAPTRLSPYDWACLDASGAVLSNHQRFDTAFVACHNNAAGAEIVGGRYRINRVAAPPVEPPAGSATIRWMPPTQNTDGTPLTNLAGFRIYYGTSTTALNRTVDVANTSSYVISGLTAGTWYFAVTAYASSGAESANSNVASKVVAS